jgi:hypothetical protein
METVKAIYPTTKDFYMAFMNSPIGQESLSTAMLSHPQYQKVSKETKLVINHIVEAMTEWLYNHTPHLHEIDIEVFMDTNHKVLCQALQKKLLDK